MTTRRTLLAGAATVLGAGCLGIDGPPGADDEDPPGEGPAGTGSPDDCTSGYGVRADAFDPAADLPLSLSESEAALAAEAVDGSATTLERYSAEPPLPDGAYVARDGGYHRLAVEATDTTAVPALLLTIEWESGRTPDDDATAVAFADLPEGDRTALSYALDGPETGGEERGRPSESLTMREFPAPYPDGTAESALAGDGATWVRRDGRSYRVTSDGETTTERHTYRVGATRVADDAAGFRAHVTERYRVDLSGLSEDARAIVQQAAGDGYRECDPASDGLTELRERLPEGGMLPAPERNAWFVTLEGERYALTVLSWVH